MYVLNFNRNNDTATYLYIYVNVIFTTGNICLQFNKQMFIKYELKEFQVMMEYIEFLVRKIWCEILITITAPYLLLYSGIYILKIA